MAGCAWPIKLNRREYRTTTVYSPLHSIYSVDMILVTTCPACNTQFRIVPDLLRVHHGLVRCGTCDFVFDANATLAQLAEDPAASDDHFETDLLSNSAEHWTQKPAVSALIDPNLSASRKLAGGDLNVDTQQWTQYLKDAAQNTVQDATHTTPPVYQPRVQAARRNLALPSVTPQPAALSEPAASLFQQPSLGGVQQQTSPDAVALGALTRPLSAHVAAPTFNPPVKKPSFGRTSPFLNNTLNPDTLSFESQFDPDQAVSEAAAGLFDLDSNPDSGVASGHDEAALARRRARKKRYLEQQAQLSAAAEGAIPAIADRTEKEPNKPLKSDGFSTALGHDETASIAQPAVKTALAQELDDTPTQIPAPIRKARKTSPQTQTHAQTNAQTNAHALQLGLPIAAADEPGFQPERVTEPPPQVSQPNKPTDAIGARTYGATVFRALAVTAAGVAALALLIQSAFVFRHQVMNQAPVLKPLYQQACQWVGCVVEPVEWLGGLSLDSLSLSRMGNGAFGAAQHQLLATVRNTSQLEILAPALELTITNAVGGVVARKTLPLSELRVTQSTLAPNSDLIIDTFLSLSPETAGYTGRLIYGATTTPLVIKPK